MIGVIDEVRPLSTAGNSPAYGPCAEALLGHGVFCSKVVLRVQDLHYWDTVSAQNNVGDFT